jgi:tRNA-binding protein
MNATINDFNILDIRVGKIIEVQAFPQARKPAYKLTIDFGSDIGIKKSSAQITENYTQEELVGQLVMCVVNFPPRQIGPFLSEVLTLGVPAENNTVVLVQPQQDVPLGGRLY